jgi:Type II secretion system (T2SS), protein F
VIAVCALSAGAAAAAALGPRRRGPRQRLDGVLSSSGGTPAPSPAAPEPPSRSVVRPAVAFVSVVAGVAVLGGVVGLAVGGAGAAVALLAPDRGVGRGIDPDEVAVVVDLLAGCLSAGVGMPDALDAAAVASGDGMRAPCHAVAVGLRSGMPAPQAWHGWLADPWLAPVARTAVRTAATGAAAAADLRRTATRLRAKRRAAARRRMSQATVWLVVPLGLCFLPAFVLVAVVPLVVGLVPSLH